MRLYKTISYSFAFFALFALPALGYFEYMYLLGFPDGAISEYERAAKKLYQVLVFPSIALGGYFIYLGWIPPEIGRYKKLTISISGLVILIIFATIIDQHLLLNFNHGQGG